MRARVKSIVSSILFWALPYGGLAAIALLRLGTEPNESSLLLVSTVVFAGICLLSSALSFMKGYRYRIACLAAAIAAQAYTVFLFITDHFDVFDSSYSTLLFFALSAIPLGSAVVSLLGERSPVITGPRRVLLLAAYPLLAVILSGLAPFSLGRIGGIATSLIALALSGLGIAAIVLASAAYRDFLRREARAGHAAIVARVRSIVRIVGCLGAPLACLGLNALLVRIFMGAWHGNESTRPLGDFSWPWFLIVAAGGTALSLPKPRGGSFALLRIFALGTYLPVSTFFLIASLPFIPFAPLLTFFYGSGLALLAAPFNFLIHLREFFFSAKRWTVSRNGSVRKAILVGAIGASLPVAAALAFSVAIRISLPGGLAFTRGERQSPPAAANLILPIALGTGPNRAGTDTLIASVIGLDPWIWGEGTLADALIAPIATAGLDIPHQDLEALWLAFDRSAAPDNRRSRLSSPRARAGGAGIGSEGFTFKAEVISSSFHRGSRLWKSDVRLTIECVKATERFMEFACGIRTPEEILIGDHFLFIGDRREEGRIFAEGAASAAYAEVVRRARDPSILKKTARDAYELRVFPFSRDETRFAGFSVYHPSDTVIEVGGKRVHLSVGPLYESPAWLASDAEKESERTPEILLFADYADGNSPAFREGLDRVRAFSPALSSIKTFHRSSVGFYPLPGIKHLLEARSAEGAVIPVILAESAYYPCRNERAILEDLSRLAPYLDGVYLMDPEGLSLLDWAGEKRLVSAITRPYVCSLVEDSSGSASVIRSWLAGISLQARDNPYFRLIELECAATPDPERAREREALVLSRRLNIVARPTASAVFEDAAQYEALEKATAAVMESSYVSMSEPNAAASLLMAGAALAAAFIARKRKNRARD